MSIIVLFYAVEWFLFLNVWCRVGVGAARQKRENFAPAESLQRCSPRTLSLFRVGASFSP